MKLEYIYVVVVCCAGLIGLFTLRKESLAHFKFIGLLVAYTMLVETTSILFKDIFSLKRNVHPQYNVFLLVEFLFYAYFFKQVIRHGKIKSIISWFLVLFPVAWYVLVFCVGSILNWNSYMFLVGATFMVILCAAYFYEFFNSEEITVASKNGVFWIVTGLFSFYACAIPYMGMYNFLMNGYSELAIKLKVLLQISNIILYSLMGYAFLCQRKTINTRKFIS